MAINQAMCSSFKKELLEGVHNFKNGQDTFKLALYTSSASLGPATTAYTTSGEIANGNGYTTKGVALTNVNPSLDSTTAITDFSNAEFTSATITANGALIFNESATNDPAVAVLAFGGDKTSTAGTFTIQFPDANASNAIIRIA